MKDPDYTPIDCGLYDLLEILSMRKTPVALVPNDLEIDPPYYITTLQTRDSIEYMTINGKVEMRLDRIDSIDEDVIILMPI
jgi:transcriptional antiterminator Rof (Rho-off)